MQASYFSMDYDEYFKKGESVSALVEKGDYRAAMDLAQSLLSSDISDLDKSIMSLNMAIIHTKMSSPVDETLLWFDRGIALETPLHRCRIAIDKMAHMAERKKPVEALAICEELLRRRETTESEKVYMQRNVDTLKKRISAGT